MFVIRKDYRIFFDITFTAVFISIISHNAVKLKFNFQRYCTLEGLDYRLKTPTSTYEKMYGRATSKPITEMNDLIRYTEIFEPDQLA